MKVYVDEVGCAAIAGPLVVCAVADNGCRPMEELKDSKAYTQKRREVLCDLLSPELPHAFGAANIKMIERMNIHYAKFESMRQAVLKLVSRGIKVDEVIVDGNFTIPNLNLPQQAVIKADEKLWCCSAASILAKVTRDRMMTKLGETFVDFDWRGNKGYYSPKHMMGIVKHGFTPLHRTGFKYARYCGYERSEFLKSEASLEGFFDFVSNYKKANGVSRYSEWVKLDRVLSKCGERKW